ncbi:MAG: YHS domain-containing protein [Candidatus Omnitrophica bacterium]|nr:YHS domain-containing protein [Candidatus Omnitrophota bacterium]
MKKVIFLIGLFCLGALSVTAQDHHGEEMGQGMAHQMGTPSAENDLGICPVMGGEAQKEYSYTYKGKTYYFCCPMCIGKFKEDPEKYISKIKEIPFQAYRFGYEPQDIIVNKGDIVCLMATSRDVPHGVYIGEYGINATVKKGEVKKIEFVADKTGEFPVLCSIYCGRGHSQMKAKLIVDE